MLVKSLDYIFGAIKMLLLAPMSNVLNSYPNVVVSCTLPNLTMTDILLKYYCSLCSTPRRGLPEPCRRPSPSPTLAAPPLARPAGFLVLVSHKLRYHGEHSDLSFHAFQLLRLEFGSLTRRRRRRRRESEMLSNYWYKIFE